MTGILRDFDKKHLTFDCALKHVAPTCVEFYTLHSKLMDCFSVADRGLASWLVNEMKPKKETK